MRLGDTLKKAAGLIVEFDEEPASSADNFEELMKESREAMSSTPAPMKTKTVEQIVKEQPGPNLEDIKVPQTPPEPMVDGAGNVNYPAVYKMASLPDAAFTAEQVLEILHSLPAELPLEAKRATLKVTLTAIAKTNGVTPEAVVADASRKLAALAAFGQSYSEHAKQYVAKAEQQITAAQAEIERLKLGIADAQRKEQQAIESCQKESDRLDDVLEFFSLDVPPSKYAT